MVTLYWGYLQLQRCIGTDLIASLNSVPPDVESLRVYLLLPLYHEFLQPKFFEELQCRFASALLSLKPDAGGRVYGKLQLLTFKRKENNNINNAIPDMWLASTKTEYFARLINILKQVVIHIICLPSSFDPTEVYHLKI